MSAEAIARLRATATMHSDFLHIPVSVDDLRALLDAHTEALDALADVLAWRDAAQRSEVLPGRSETLDITEARAVLAKAGRR